MPMMKVIMNDPKWRPLRKEGGDRIMTSSRVHFGRKSPAMRKKMKSTVPSWGQMKRKMSGRADGRVGRWEGGWMGQRIVM